MQVLTGFLGSGKTTLLNRILTADHGHRIAVIENEVCGPGVTFALAGSRSSPPPRSLALQFGEIDIDSELVSIREELDPNDEQIMMLNNGCLCCTVRDDLVDMLNKLVRKSWGKNIQLKNISPPPLSLSFCGLPPAKYTICSSFPPCFCVAEFSPSKMR